MKLKKMMAPQEKVRVLIFNDHEWANLTRNIGAGTTLSKQETKIMRLVARGASNAKVAEELELSTNAVSTNMRRIFQKLGCRNRVEAAAIATKRGLL